MDSPDAIPNNVTGTCQIDSLQDSEVVQRLQVRSTQHRLKSHFGERWRISRSNAPVWNCLFTPRTSSRTARDADIAMRHASGRDTENRHPDQSHLNARCSQVTQSRHLQLLQKHLAIRAGRAQPSVQPMKTDSKLHSCRKTQREDLWRVARVMRPNGETRKSASSSPSPC